MNIIHLLIERETSGVRSRFSATNHSTSKALGIWAEADSIRNCSAVYCPLSPSPRSTIAAAFSPDGAVLASTHGDHTVKLFCYRTGSLLRVLTGHSRTPWVVRFHPTNPSILASGSLDYFVRIWDANTAQCIHYHDFGRPIASLAFHPEGDVLAVAAGHLIHIWKYKEPAQADVNPCSVRHTRRSLRAVNFRPHGLPLLLSAEVNEAEALHVNQPSPATTDTAPVFDPFVYDVALQTASAAASAALSGTAQPYPVLTADAVNTVPGAPRPEGPPVFTELVSPQLLQLVTAGTRGGFPAFAGSVEEGAGGGPALSAAQQEQQTAALQSTAALSAFHLAANGHQRLSRTAAPNLGLLGMAAAAAEIAVSSVMSMGGAAMQPYQAAAMAAHAATQHPTHSVPGLYSHPLPGMPGAMLQNYMAPDSAAPGPMPGGMPGPAFPPPAAPPNPGPQSGGRRRVVDTLDWSRTQVGIAAGAAAGACLWAQQGSAAAQPRTYRWPQAGETTSRSSEPAAPSQGARNGAEAGGREAMNLERTRPASEDLFRALGEPVEGGPAAGGRRPPGAASSTGPEESRFAPGPGVTWQPDWRMAARHAPNLNPNCHPTDIWHRQYQAAASAAAATAAATAAASAAMSEEQDHPLTVSMRLWPYTLRRITSRLNHSQLDIPHAVLCSEMGAHFSPCGRFLAVCVACLPRGYAAQRQASAAACPAADPPRRRDDQDREDRRRGAPPRAGDFTFPNPGANAPRAGGRAGADFTFDTQQGGAQGRPDGAAANAAAGAGPSGSVSVPKLSEALWSDLNLNANNARAPADPRAASTSAQGGAEGWLPHADNAPGRPYIPQGMTRPPPSTRPPPLSRSAGAGNAPTEPSSGPVLGASGIPGEDAADALAGGAPGRAPGAGVGPAPAWFGEGQGGGGAEGTRPGPAGAAGAAAGAREAAAGGGPGGGASTSGRERRGSGASRSGKTRDKEYDPRHLIYELRVYSLEASTFGEVLHAKEIRAAHCLTSIQFSPTSEHLLLAYGRRHPHLLRSMCMGGGNIIPVYSILEVYRVSDMEILRVVPCAEDEVNVACFHPSPGSGFAYGTKQGCLRILGKDWQFTRNVEGGSGGAPCLEDELLRQENHEN